MDRPRSAPLALIAAAALAMPLAACTGEPDSPATVTVIQTVAPPADTAEPTITPGQTVGPLPDVAPDDDAPFVANTEPDTSATPAGAPSTSTHRRARGPANRSTWTATRSWSSMCRA